MRKKFELAASIAMCAALCYCAYVGFIRLRRALDGIAPCHSLPGDSGDMKKAADGDTDACREAVDTHS